MAGFIPFRKCPSENPIMRAEALVRIVAKNRANGIVQSNLLYVA
jgi:hypothetical protein